MADFVCPKCGASMRSYERNGVTIEQCSDCRGIFLDRGELDRLIDAESSHYAAPPPQSAPGFRRDDDWDDDRSRDHGYGRSYKKKRKGFLGELFDD